MKKMQSKINSIKTGKELGTTYCFGCKDFMHNFRPEEVKMINKMLRKKSNCVLKIRIFKTKAQQQKITQRFYKLML